VKKRDLSTIQEVALSPMIEAMNRAVGDEALLRAIFIAMGPYSFDGRARAPKEWEACLRALRDRFGFDDSE
jgi:hypothetical protein